MSTSTTSLKVFLVDDDPYFLGLMEAYLEGLDFHDHHSFSRSADCLEQLTLLPDLIFLDFNMDNLNGIDILKKIKRFNPNQLVVFVSGQEKIDIAVNALKYGAFDYVMKEEVTEEKLKLVLSKVGAFKEMLDRRQKANPLRRLLGSIGLA